MKFNQLKDIRIRRILSKRGILKMGPEPYFVPKRDFLPLLKKLYPRHTDKELIRIGPKYDGGYVVPNDLKGVEACFSPGVGCTSEFDMDIVENYKLKVFMADKSVDKPKWNLAEKKYSFIKKNIGLQNDKDFMTMDEWVASSSLTNDSELLLQMDIEGGEYNAISNMSDSLMKRFRIMLIEFHHLVHLRQGYFFDIVDPMIEKILHTHICVHIHPNNYSIVRSVSGIKVPNVCEFTFIRKDRVKVKGYQTQFPNKLDYDNDPLRRRIVLPKSWYQSV